jgi:hypothetical protein
MIYSLHFHCISEDEFDKMPSIELEGNGECFQLIYNYPMALLCLISINIPDHEIIQAAVTLIPKKEQTFQLKYYPNMRFDFWPVFTLRSYESLSFSLLNLISFIPVEFFSKNSPFFQIFSDFKFHLNPRVLRRLIDELILFDSSFLSQKEYSHFCFFSEILIFFRFISSISSLSFSITFNLHQLSEFLSNFVLYFPSIDYPNTFTDLDDFKVISCGEIQLNSFVSYSKNWFCLTNTFEDVFWICTSFGKYSLLNHNIVKIHSKNVFIYYKGLIDEV